MALSSRCVLFNFCTRSSALEELSVRSNIALSQKKFLRELDCDSEDLEAEYVALCAQVVSQKHGENQLNGFPQSKSRIAIDLPHYFT